MLSYTKKVNFNLSATPFYFMATKHPYRNSYLGIDLLLNNSILLCQLLVGLFQLATVVNLFLFTRIGRLLLLTDHMTFTLTGRRPARRVFLRCDDFRLRSWSWFFGLTFGLFLFYVSNFLLLAGRLSILAFILKG